MIDGNNFRLRRVEIKKGRKHVVEGLKKVKETDQKMTMSGFEIEADPKFGMLKYTKSLELLGSRLMSCVKEIPFQPFQSVMLGKDANIRVCLVCLHINQVLGSEEEINLKFFMADLREKSINALI